MKTKFTVWQGDILTCAVDAIVNPANITLQGRGGLSGKILAAGGKEMLAACKAFRFCTPGSAVITLSLMLPCRYVIHAVGPEWRGGLQGEAETLAQCYRSILSLAKENQLQSLAIPAISTGIFRYPLQAATEIAIRTVFAEASAAGIERVDFVCWDDTTFETYQAVMTAYDLSGTGSVAIEAN